VSWLRGVWRWLSGLEAEAEPSAASNPEPHPQPDFEAPVSSANAGLSGGEPAEESPQPDNEPIRKEPVSRRQVVIGLDLGTSSTKVTYRWISAEETFVYPPRKPAEGYPRFATPTTVQVVDGRLRLGEGTEGIQGASSMKRDFLFGNQEQRQRAETEMTWFLAWLLDHVSEEVCRNLGVDDFHPIINVGVPIAFHEPSDQGGEYPARLQGIISRALAMTKWQGGKGIRDGQSVKTALGDLASAVSRQHRFEDIVHVLPESIASVVSLWKSDQSSPGAFGIIDIGAGTTEVAVGFLSRGGDGVTHVQCYADQSRDVGAAIFQGAEASEDDSRQLEILRDWWAQWIRTWEMARRKDSGERLLYEAWNRVTVMFTGGGGSHPSVRPFFMDQDTPLGLSLSYGSHRPGGLVAKFGQGDMAHDHLLAVAHGLSFHRRSEWPKWYNPGEVDDHSSAGASESDLEYTARGWV
jgi:hypothetical protein